MMEFTIFGTVKKSISGQSTRKHLTENMRGIGTGIWVNEMLKIATLILIVALIAAYITAREE